MIGEELAKSSESQGKTRNPHCPMSHEKGVSEGGGAHSATLLRMTREIKIGKTCLIWQRGDHE